MEARDPTYDANQACGYMESGFQFNFTQSKVQFLKILFTCLEFFILFQTEFYLYLFLREYFPIFSHSYRGESAALGHFTVFIFFGQVDNKESKKI